MQEQVALECRGGGCHSPGRTDPTPCIGELPTDGLDAGCLLAVSGQRRNTLLDGIEYSHDTRYVMVSSIDPVGMPQRDGALSRVVIAGGTGMLGRALGASLASDGVEVIALTRRTDDPGVPPGVRTAPWDGRTLDETWTHELADVDAVVDLCGLSVGTWPWTGGTRTRLRSSRLEPRTALMEAMSRMPEGVRPATFLAISGTDGYVGSDAGPAGEDTPLADTFLGRLCADWEAVAMPAHDLRVRVVIARSAVVVAPDAPVLARLILPVRLLVGGRIGSGRQWFSWVHVTDWVAAMRRLLDDSSIEGPVNIASPGALRQADVARALGRVRHRPSVVPTPAFAIRLLLGGQADLVLGSRRVAPARLTTAGFAFGWTDFEAAVRDVTT